MRKGLVFILVLTAILQGCASMSAGERAKYEEITTVGAQCENVADPGAAAVLNILLGTGNIYLATGKGANPANWGAFVFDFLMWPISVVWSVPQGIITANEINKIECAGYYGETDKGRLALAKIKNERMAEQANIEMQDSNHAMAKQENVASTTKNEVNNVDKLKELKEMYDGNLITKEEYEEKRKLILEKI